MCIWLRNKNGNICDLPGSGPLRVECRGNQLFCAMPLRLALTESEQVVEDEPESDWARLVREEQEIRNGGR